MTTPVYAFNDKRQFDMLISREKYNLLISYYYLNQKNKLEEFLEYMYSCLEDKDFLFMLDSGAYSAWKSGKIVKLYEFIDFIKKYHKYFTHIVCLDVIDNPVYSEVNHLIMLEELDGLGLEVIPVFHAGEPFTVLDYMIKKGYTYIGISPNNGWKEDKKRAWLSRVYSRYNFDKLGVKTHAFGYQTPEGVSRFPFTTADSITWKIAAGYGRIIDPVNPSVRVSERAVGMIDHVDSIPGGHSEFAISLCEELGITLEELSTNHDARSLFNIEAIDRIIRDTSRKIMSVSYDIFGNEETSLGYGAEFNQSLIQLSYEKVKKLGRDYLGVPDEEKKSS